MCPVRRAEVLEMKEREEEEQAMDRAAIMKEKMGEEVEKVKVAIQKIKVKQNAYAVPDSHRCC